MSSQPYKCRGIWHQLLWGGCLLIRHSDFLVLEETVSRVRSMGECAARVDFLKRPDFWRQLGVRLL
jgi:hypothetical protein